ncbi:anosmin-1-like isoform X1 [Nerophis lumbriciformis]|uniref:anosmin-1-like isoform X1 n=1 Tax=Nerophis lumbriciformis TaxID=546530 RepID=UPI002ADFD4CC|nr:anosmin-1-like isoform X1 [Nerophis lumbriciformis]
MHMQQWIIPLLFIFLCDVCSKKLLRCIKDDDDDDGKDGESWLESFPRARCKSRCLSLHSAATLQNNGSLSWCHSQKECAKCLEPCKNSWFMKKKKNCRELCERLFPKKHWECLASCQFLESVMELKQGECPPPDWATGFAAACVESCDYDTECPAQKKCCSNTCGHTCQTPKDLYKGVPSKPRKQLGFEEVFPGQLEVRWNPRINMSAEPVVYILQKRWNFGIQPSEDAATPWQIVANTTEQRVRLSDIRPGRWYQFRVTAVNMHGTRGFTTPSRHICSSRDPTRPPAPTELRVTNMMFTASSAVQVQLQWCMQGDLDVPVHHYKVSWTWTGQIPASSMTKRKKIVRESQVVLDSMQSNRSYSVEVQAVCYWKQTQLKGPRAIVHFQTLHDKSRDLPGDILDVGTPFYQNGQLQVHIYWKSSTDPSVEYYRIQWIPEYCEHNQTAQRKKTNTQGTFFNMQDLLFSCKYKVLLQPISRTSHQPAKSISFITPSCAAIQAKSPKLIACHGVTPQKVLVKLTNLTVSFKFHGSNMTTNFNWGVSSHRYLTGYQVTLVEVTSSGRLDNKKLHRGFTSQAQILPQDVSSLVVSGLHATSVYRLEVRAIVADGEGHAISRIFQTPGLHKVEKHRKYD